MEFNVNIKKRGDLSIHMPLEFEPISNTEIVYICVDRFLFLFYFFNLKP